MTENPAGLREKRNPRVYTMGATRIRPVFFLFSPPSSLVRALDHVMKEMDSTSRGTRLKEAFFSSLPLFPFSPPRVPGDGGDAERIGATNAGYRLPPSFPFLPLPPAASFTTGKTKKKLEEGICSGGRVASWSYFPLHPPLPLSFYEGDGSKPGGGVPLSLLPFLLRLRVSTQGNGE